MSLYSTTKFICAGLILFSCASAGFGQTRARHRKDVIEAVRVCNRFKTLFAENLDFDRAFEATFVRNAARRREIAITEGEFDRDNVASVDTATLVDAFKSRMQLLFLTMPLFSPESDEVAATFFPPKFKEALKREPPAAASEFASYAAQLKRDVSEFRAHLDQLAQRYPNVAERVREFKRDFGKKIERPAQPVKPLTAYSRGRVLGLKEEYYQIGEFAVIREGREMRIIGIRFFTRLF